MEEFSSQGSLFNSVEHLSESEYTASARGSFSGKGTSNEFGAFTTRRWGNFQASRRGIAWDSAGNPVSYQQSQSYREAFSITSTKLQKTATLAVETKVDRLENRTYFVYLNGIEIQPEDEMYSLFIPIFQDLENPLVSPELLIF